MITDFVDHIAYNCLKHSSKVSFCGMFAKYAKDVYVSVFWI